MDTITLSDSTRELSPTIARDTELYRQFPDASDLKYEDKLIVHQK